jgi:hypothetical protein
MRLDDMSGATHEQAVRQDAVVSCSMCGIRMPGNQMVPDGGSAYGDIQWYCKDTCACTERWTSAQHQTESAGRGWMPVVVSGRHQRS